jgi:hypothetical protein
MTVFWDVAARGLLIALIMEGASISKTSANSTRLHDVTSQNTVIFILTAVRT